MRKTLMLLFTLLVSAAWIQAQQYPNSGSSQSGRSSQTQTQGQNTRANHSRTGAQKVEGCLQASDGGYTLTDNAGATYKLQGDSSMLAEHVGHEVQITGTPQGSSAESTGTIGGGEETLQVKNVKHIAKTCSSAGK